MAEGDDPRGWIRYTLTALWPMCAAFALCAWGVSTTRGGWHDLLITLLCVTWGALATTAGYRRNLRQRYPLPRRRR